MHLVKSKRILILRRKYDTIPFLYFRGVYSAQNSFFSPCCRIFICFPLLFFSSKEGEIMEKYIQNSLFHIIPPFLVFYIKEGRKTEKMFLVFLIFTFLSPNHIFFFIFAPLYQGQFCRLYPWARIKTYTLSHSIYLNIVVAELFFYIIVLVFLVHMKTLTTPRTWRR